MSSKRGKRGSSKSHDAVVIKVRDEAQMQRALDLSSIIGDKPKINSIMPSIVHRLDEESRLESLALANRWRDMSWSEIYGSIDDYGFDDFENLYNKKRYKRFNKKSYKKHNKHNHGMFPMDDYDNEDNYDMPYKSIKFYPDVDNELSVIEFHSLKDFSDYCSENNYVLSTTDYNNLLEWSVIHCCLDPISLEYGDNEIITDTSYGGLYWTVSEDLPVMKEQLSNGLNKV